MDADLRPIYDRVTQAVRPEEVFKELTVVLPPRLLKKHLAPEMDEMRTILDETKYSSFDDREAVRLARARLESLYGEAVALATIGLYAIDGFSEVPLPSGSKMIAVGGRQYAVGLKFHVGAHADVYHGRVRIGTGSGAVAIRVAHTPQDNPLLFNEIRMLETLHRQDVGYWKNVPFMLDRFSASERVGIMCRYFDGLPLSEIRADPLYRDGLDQRHVVWVMDRLLGLLGYAHGIGVMHGRINPDRIRVRPSNHNAILTGWSHAVYKPAVTGERRASEGGPFEAPEVSSGGEIGPWTDIYCLGKTLIWLIGGDVLTNAMPDGVEPKLRRFLVNMVRKNPRARPSDAWQLYEAQNRLKDSLWERRFIHLNLSNRS